MACLTSHSSILCLTYISRVHFFCLARSDWLPLWWRSASKSFAGWWKKRGGKNIDPLITTSSFTSFPFFKRKSNKKLLSVKGGSREGRRKALYIYRVCCEEQVLYEATIGSRHHPLPLHPDNKHHQPSNQQQQQYSSMLDCKCLSGASKCM